MILEPSGWKVNSQYIYQYHDLNKERTRKEQNKLQKEAKTVNKTHRALEQQIYTIEGFHEVRGH